jgi:nucleolar protein 14
MTPAMLLMSEYLLRCPVTSARDVAIGSFICSLLLSVMRPACRFCPEALNFLHALLLSTVPNANHSEGAQDLTKQCPVDLFNFVVSSPWLRLSTRGSPEVELQPLDILALLVADDSSPIFESDSFRVGILGSVLQTLNGFAGIYKDLMSFPEVFSPFLSVLDTIPKENALPEALQSLITHVAGSITQQMIQHEHLRQPLHMRVSKPVPIKQFNPRFEANYVQGRDYDPDCERAEKKKLVWQLKHEAKGAVRELRKDNHFLAKEKAKERSLAEEEHDKKYCEAITFLQGQESAFKSGQLGKGRKKRKQ